MIHITITRRGKGVGRNWLVRIGQIIRESLMIAGMEWRDTMLPEHFKPAAGGKYNYHRRTAKYIKRKFRRHIAEPMVWSGRTKREMLSDRRQPTATMTKVTVSLPSERYMHIKMHGWDHRLRDEIIRMTGAEEKILAEVIKKNIIRGMNEDKAALHQYRAGAG